MRMIARHRPQGSPQGTKPIHNAAMAMTRRIVAKVRHAEQIPTSGGFVSPEAAATEAVEYVLRLPEPRP